MNTRHRLENWALWVKCKGGAGDPVDARKLDEAIFMLSEAHKTMLVTAYTYQLSHESVCRHLKIPVRPASRFVEAFNHAEQALQQALERNCHVPDSADLVDSSESSREAACEQSP